MCADSQSTMYGICSHCWENLPWLAEQRCRQCALPLPNASSTICGACLRSQPFFDRTIAAIAYDFPLDALLKQYKYRQSLKFTPFLTQILYQHIHADSTTINTIIPMPMHAERYRLRGFNHALELAKRLSRLCNITLHNNLCVRTRDTPPQAGLALDKRIKNTRGVFACTQSIQGKRIAIVDDVMTSGASLNAVSKALKKSGADYVECWVVARSG